MSDIGQTPNVARNVPVSVAIAVATAALLAWSSGPPQGMLGGDPMVLLTLVQFAVWATLAVQVELGPLMLVFDRFCAATAPLMTYRPPFRCIIRSI
jgi:hypothetical protein